MNAVRRLHTTYIQSNEHLENHRFLKLVKIRHFLEFLKFLKFALSIYVANS